MLTAPFEIICFSIPSGELKIQRQHRTIASAAGWRVFPTEGQRKKLKEAIVSIIDEFGFTLINTDKVRSSRDYNRYVVEYPTVFPTSFLKEHLIVETAVYIKAYPCKRIIRRKRYCFPSAVISLFS